MADWDKERTPVERDPVEAAYRLILADLKRCLARIAADRGCDPDDLSTEVMAALEDFGLSCVQKAQQRESQRPTVTPPDWPLGNV